MAAVTTTTTTTTPAEITRLDLEAIQPPEAFITDVKHLSSYNWIEAQNPTIAVPGSPPLWTAPSGPRLLKKDSGLHYIAQNAARHPDSPLEPLFRALYIEQPSFNMRSVDVVTDRNNIRKLLSFVNPASSRNGLEAFTIRVEVVDKTAIFSREEAATTEFVGPNDFHGYGFEFEKAYTTSQIPGSTGHYRILSYSFGGLNFVIRHETDAYVADVAGIAGAGLPAAHRSTAAADSDGLSSMLSSLSLSSTNGPLNVNSPATTTLAGSKLRTKKQGRTVSREATLEIKTRVIHRRLEFQDIAPQLWVSQTPRLVRAYHKRGTFGVPEVEDMAADIKGWEQRSQRDLKRLAALIRKIVNVVRERGGHALVQYKQGMGDKLVVYWYSGDMALPTDLYAKWDGGDGSEKDEATKQINVPVKK